MVRNNRLKAIIIVLASAVLSVAFPLFTYTFTLATFGLTHVLTELHYVNNRFSQRFVNTLRQNISVLLLLIISLRTLQVLSLIPTWLSIPLELSCVVGLVALVTPILAKKDRRLGLLAIAFGVSLIVGIFWSASLTLLLFAVLHNITPIGFIAERLRGRQRYDALLICGLVFAIIPLIIISGIPYNFLSSIGLLALEASLFPVGGLEVNLGIFVPSHLHSQTIAIHAFSATVFLQSMHYAVVIGVLPKWENNCQPKTVYFPLSKQYQFINILLSILLFIGFTISFTDARAVYGIVAALHAWVEIPVLLLALAIPEPIINQ